MANPIIGRTQQITSTRPMTVQGVVQKTSFLLALSAVSGFGLFFYALMAGLSSSLLYSIVIATMVAGIGMGIFSAVKPRVAKTIAVPFALSEGLLIGALSAIVFRIYPSVPLLALCATFTTAAVMLGLYATGMIKVTQKMRSIVLSAVVAIMLLYAVQWGMQLIFSSSLPYLFDGGVIAIGFSIFVILIASFSLLLDFDNVDKSVHYGVDESFEWVHGMGILSTLVWMYIEFLRLLGYFQE